MGAGFISKGFYGLTHDNLSPSYDELSDYYDIKSYSATICFDPVPLVVG
jgi:hypothetical protein